MNKSRHCGNGIACKQATPRAALGFCSANRAENLCYQFSRGQKLPPQFRKIVGLVLSIGWDTHTRIENIRQISNSLCHSERIEESRGNETSLYTRHFTSFRYREIATPNKSARNDNMVIFTLFHVILSVVEESSVAKRKSKLCA